MSGDEVNDDIVTGTQSQSLEMPFDPSRHRFPFCVVWTPIPVLTWICPLIGHMGIAMSSGVIRDFAGPFYVSEDNMAFGWPTKYWQLSPNKAKNGISGWDHAVFDASEVYKGRTHNLCCDNCHSHVAMSLNKMNYNNSSSWNMVKLAFLMAFKGKYVSFKSWIQTWIPFFILVTLCIVTFIIIHYTEYTVTIGHVDFSQYYNFVFYVMFFIFNLFYKLKTVNICKYLQKSKL